MFTLPLCVLNPKMFTCHSKSGKCDKGDESLVFIFLIDCLLWHVFQLPDDGCPSSVGGFVVTVLLLFL